MKRLIDTLENLKAAGTFRELEGCNVQHLSLRPIIDLVSNDYLGLAADGRLQQAVIHAVAECQTHSAPGSRLLGGQTRLHAEIEEELAASFHSQSALLFSSGYLANLGVLSALCDTQTEIFSDELNHASLIDGMRLCRARRSIYRHNDMDHLESLLRRSDSAASPPRRSQGHLQAPLAKCAQKPSCGVRRMIVTESVFSMDGDLAPLAEISRLARRFEAWVFVDEAHATGVFGPNGRGRAHAAELNFCRETLVTTHTGGKALASAGAFVTSSMTVRAALVNFARPFLFSTALSPLVALQLRAAVRLMQSESGKGAQLLQTAAAFRERLGAGEPNPSQSQIVPVIVGSPQRALALASHLRQHGFATRAIRFPTVAAGTERLRLSLKTTHRPEDLERLAQLIREGLQHA